MQQVWIPRTGSPDVLELREAPDPTPDPGAVRVRVHAAGINFADILARMGLYPDAPPIPCVVGYEVSGVIDAVGDGVDPTRIGQRVVAMTRFGGYASSICVPEKQAVPLADSISFHDAAAIPVVWLTAWIMLVRLGNLQKGERVLIHSAGGGVGLAAVQIAKWRGAEIFGTASPGKHERLREYGVHHCIDYRSQNFADEVERITDGRGVHLIIDAVGGRSFRDSYRSLAPMGRLFCFGVSTMAPGEKRSIFAALKGLFAMPRFAPIPLMQQNRGVFGVNLGQMWDLADELAEILREVLEGVEDGRFHAVVDTTFAAADASDAHRYIQDRRNFGKVVLTFDHDAS